MGTKARYLSTILALFALFSCVVSRAQTPSDTTHDRYNRLLQAFASEQGVAYRDWSEQAGNVAELSRYIDDLEALDLELLTRSQRLAYWINLYNAATLELVLAHYPIRSIKKIGGILRSPWNLKVVTIGGEALSLNQIENEIIRPRFNDPRILFALNCAAIGCPLLRGEAYQGWKLDAQLDDACRLALNDPRWVELKGNKLKLTKIFDWYGADFGSDNDGKNKFITTYHNGPIPSNAKISYRKYDWNLNEK